MATIVQKFHIKRDESAAPEDTAAAYAAVIPDGFTVISVENDIVYASKKA
jgi:hypothetical protein